MPPQLNPGLHIALARGLPACLWADVGLLLQVLNMRLELPLGLVLQPIGLPSYLLLTLALLLVLSHEVSSCYLAKDDGRFRKLIAAVAFEGIGMSRYARQRRLPLQTSECVADVINTEECASAWCWHVPPPGVGSQGVSTWSLRPSS